MRKTRYIPSTSNDYDNQIKHAYGFMNLNHGLRSISVLLLVGIGLYLKVIASRARARARARPAIEGLAAHIR